MNILKAIIIDDEASARENLELLLSRFCLQVNCLGAFSGLESGVRFLKNNPIDVVFLDVEMPNYAGYEIVQFFKEINFQIIFVTAYDEYAMKAFELSAVDYLLKPIDIERLKSAVQKVEQNALTKELADKYVEVADYMDQQKEPKLSVLQKGSRVFIPFREILAVEANEAYSIIHRANGEQYVYSKNISAVENELRGYPSLFRSHKSWMVNLKEIKELITSENVIVLNNDMSTKISRAKMKHFKDLMRE